jgi:hypothetical protein
VPNGKMTSKYWTLEGENQTLRGRAVKKAQKSDIIYGSSLAVNFIVQKLKSKYIHT